MNTHVRIEPLKNGLIEDFSTDEFPSQYYGLIDSTFNFSSNVTSFGYVLKGHAVLNCKSGQFEISEGMYFCVPDGGTIICKGKSVIFSRLNYKGLFQLGGPLEEKGRLIYIDGCSDSLLFSPILKGEPCLNMLFVPPHTNQSAHTHPSLRLGVVVAGSGICKTDTETFPLEAGSFFILYTDKIHSFHTINDFLRIVVYHPDSDFGPTHEIHPMINKTFIQR